MTAVKDQVRNAEAQAAKARRGLERDGRRLVAQAGASVAAPTPERLRKGVALVTSPAQTEVQADGSVKRTPARTGFKAVSKIDTLYARGALDDAQYLAAQAVLRQFELARLDAKASVWLLAGGGGAFAAAGYADTQMKALQRLRKLRVALGKMQFDLLKFVLLDEGDLADWGGFAKQTKAKQPYQRSGAAMALLQMTLNQIANGA